MPNYCSVFGWKNNSKTMQHLCFFKLPKDEDRYLIIMILPTAFPYRYFPEEPVRPYDRNAPVNSHVLQVGAKDRPYHALVVYKGLYCSGSLVSSRVIVTAASCLHKYQDHDHPFVKVGSSAILDAGDTISVSDVKIHEFFQHTSIVDNDIAILVLTTHVTFGPNVEKIVLIETSTALRIGTGISVSGWGSTNVRAKYMNKLLVTQMIVMDNTQCEDVFGVLITNSNFCASYDPDGRLSDNGGPATHGRLLVGILSFGALRKSKPNVAVFTNVSYFHKWIVKNSKEYLKKYCVIPPSYSEYSYEDDALETDAYNEEATK